MLHLTEEQQAFLAHHKIPLSAVFDASTLSKAEYRVLMEKLEKHVAIGVMPCRAKNHTIRSRSGHCLQCNPAAFAFYQRYYKNAFVYIAASADRGKIKVGYTKDIEAREESLNRSSYAGITDWKIVYHVMCNNAGEIESEIQSRLSDYFSPEEYHKENRLVACYELFSCSYKTVKEVLHAVKVEYPDKEFSGEKEWPNLESLFDFTDVRTNEVRRGNKKDRVSDEPNVDGTQHFVVEAQAENCTEAPKRESPGTKHKKDRGIIIGIVELTLLTALLVSVYLGLK